MNSPSKSGKIKKLNYICIHCSYPVKELFKKYSPSVLKIINCKNCDEVADKYIEFEPMIIAIDLILLSRPAYKHLLYNTEFKNHWKLLVVILLLEAYILYKNKSRLITSHHGNNFTLEKLFYFCFGLIVLENLILFILLRTTLVFARTTNAQNPKQGQTDFALNLIKSITIAHVAKFFQLPMLIWNKHTSGTVVLLNSALVMGYIMLALTHVFSVVSNRGRFFSALIILLILVQKTVIMAVINVHLEAYFF